MIYDVFGLLVIFMFTMEMSRKLMERGWWSKTELSLMYGMANAIGNTEAESKL